MKAFQVGTFYTTTSTNLESNEIRTRPWEQLYIKVICVSFEYQFHVEIKKTFLQIVTTQGLGN